MEVSNLMFYAQSTSTVLSGRIQMEEEEEKEGCEEKKMERWDTLTLTSAVTTQLGAAGASPVSILSRANALSVAFTVSILVGTYST